jgi:hypothetical protein
LASPMAAITFAAFSWSRLSNNARCGIGGGTRSWVMMPAEPGLPQTVDGASSGLD